MPGRPADQTKTDDGTDRQPSGDELAILAADPEMLSMFVGEALDHLGTIESVVLQLESAPADVKLLNDVFRPFHTVKGNAGALGVTSVQELAHCVENLLDLARAGTPRDGAGRVRHRAARGRSADAHDAGAAGARGRPARRRR